MCVVLVVCFFFSTSINIEFLLYMFCVLYNMKCCFLCVNAKIKLFFVFCMELLQRVFNSAFFITERLNHSCLEYCYTNVGFSLHIIYMQVSQCTSTDDISEKNFKLLNL